MVQKSTFFTEIVGLRIYLALWVAIGHGLQTAGFLEPTNRVLDFFLSGHEAVALFMIISGFVITNLLMVKKESYPAYITRRFFRLFPAYVLACIAGYAIIDHWAYIVANMPWSAEPAAISAAKNIYVLRDQATYNVAPHIAAHAFMLHGLLPDEVLPAAPMTFLPAAWSISLEWQFYLLAPFILAAISDSKRTLGLVVISLAMVVAYRMGLLGHYFINATIAGNIHFFLLGIASRLFFERLSALPVSPLLGAAVVVLASIGINISLAPTIWGIFYSYSLWHRNAPITGQVFRTLTQSRPFQLLGEASYSLYLIHRPLQILMIALLIDKIELTHASVFMTQLFAIAVALPLSVALYFTVERRGIAIGRVIARRLTLKEGSDGSTGAATQHGTSAIEPVKAG